MLWTEQQDAELRSIINKGGTTGIAAKLMGLSRNSTMARARRLGLQLKSRPGNSADRPKPIKKPGRIAAGMMPAGPMGPKPEHRPRTVLIEQAPEARCSIFDLPDFGVCKWPYNTEKGYVFCGNPAKGSYCEGHNRVAYTPQGRRVFSR